MIFVGYEPGSKAYRAYDPVTRRVHISRDIVFDEEAQWEWDDKAIMGDDTDFTIEYTSMTGKRQLRHTCRHQARRH
ncbi:hypothetical protein E2562_016042 [Oryza meyeriana var. granulata]|uniref:Retroviral polymerase SH3-like domain-containing protein n=1 Tax=Oryza meyeriana var. granulata TaxID=110450 RepID=A0A6G1BMD2_9ORYZ|nr:hypothetical protein E2562_016042 [Oryza meyeriana var. granulata]